MVPPSPQLRKSFPRARICLVTFLLLVLLGSWSDLKMIKIVEAQNETSTTTTLSPPLAPTAVATAPNGDPIFQRETPFPQEGGGTTRAPADSNNTVQDDLIRRATPAPREVLTVNFLEVVEAKEVTTRYWWLIMISVSIVIALCALLSLLRQWVEGRPQTTVFLLYTAVNKNLAVIGLATALVRATENWIGDANVRWAFILSWSYFTLFIISLVLSVQVAVAVFGVHRQMQMLMDWEVHLPSGGRAAAAKGGADEIDPVAVGIKQILMTEIRHVFRRQIALMYPGEKKSIRTIKVANYLSSLQNALMLSLVSFNWKNWLAVCVFAILNALRQTAVALDNTVVDDRLLVIDCATFVFGLGVIPLIIFLIFSFLLNRSVVAYLQAAKKQVDDYYEAQRAGKPRHSKLVADILRSRGAMSETTLSMDPNSPVDPADFVSPIGYLVFKRTSMTLGVYRTCVLFNSVYIAFLIMGISEAMMTRIEWGTVMLVAACIPSIVVLYLLPWSSLLLVTICSLGPNLDLEVVKKLRQRSSYNPLYPMHLRFEDPDDPATNKTTKSGNTKKNSSSPKRSAWSDRSRSEEPLNDNRSGNSDDDDETDESSSPPQKGIGGVAVMTPRDVKGTSDEITGGILLNPLARLAAGQGGVKVGKKQRGLGQGAVGGSPKREDRMSFTGTPPPPAEEVQELMDMVDGKKVKAEDEELAAIVQDLSPKEKLYGAEREEIKEAKEKQKLLLELDPVDRARGEVSEEEMMRRFELNLSRVNRRIQEIKKENTRLGDEIQLASDARAKKERGFHQLVGALINRPDLSLQWREKLKNTETALAMREKVKRKQVNDQNEIIRRKKILRHMDRSFLTDEEKAIMDSVGTGAATNDVDLDAPAKVVLHRAMTSHEVLKMLEPTKADMTMHLPRVEIKNLEDKEDANKRWLIDKMKAQPLTVDERAEAKRRERQERRMKRLAEAAAETMAIRAKAEKEKLEREKELQRKIAEVEGRGPPAASQDNAETAVVDIPSTEQREGQSSQAATSNNLLSAPPTLDLDPSPIKHEPPEISMLETDTAVVTHHAADGTALPPVALAATSGVDSWTNSEHDFDEALKMMESLGYSAEGPAGRIDDLDLLDDVAAAAALKAVEMDPGELSDSLESIHSEDLDAHRKEKEYRNALKIKKKSEEKEKLRQELDYSSWGAEDPILSYADMLDLKAEVEREEEEQKLKKMQVAGKQQKREDEEEVLLRRELDAVEGKKQKNPKPSASQDKISKPKSNVSTSKATPSTLAIDIRDEDI